MDYEKAMSYKANKQYYDAAVQFYSLQGFEDSREQSFACWRELTNSDSPLLAFDCHVVALQNDGTVVATGRNGEGQINVSGWNNIKAISTTFDRTVGLKADGTVVATGSNFYGETDVSDWTDIVAINASGRPTIGLKSDGTVVAVGYNFDGQCDAVAQWRDIVRIECFYDIIVGWKADGSIVAAGPNTHNLLDIVNWTDVVDISMGSYHAVGLKADGTAVALGGNGRGQCDVDGWTDLAAVYANSTYTIGLKKDGSVLVAGWDKSEAWDISDWTDIVSIDLSGFHAVGLKSDGTVVAAGHDYYGQCNVSGWKNIVAICADSYSTVGLKADGTVVAVGKNDEGQCNVGDWQNIFVAKSKEVPKGTYHNDGETTTAITSVLYDKSGNLLKAGEFLEIYESIVDLAHQRYYSSSVSIKKVENSGLRHNYGFYINGKASSTTIGFTYGGNDTLADGTFDQINIMHYSGSSDESADAFFFISTLMSMATPSVGNVWDSTEIIEDMLNKISSSSSTATYEADGIVYTLGAIAMGGKTMMTFAVKIQ